MTERERLIELLIKAHITFGTGKIADYLLVNGVIVPPCKVGDTIYIVNEYSNEFDGIDECRVTSLLWDGTSWMIFTNKDEYGYTESQIFFTKEEAIKGVKL